MKSKFKIIGMIFIAAIIGFSMIGCDINVGNNKGGDTYYTVRFMDGKTEIDSRKVKEGEKVTLPANPAKEGFSFDAWYTDEALTKKFDAATPITKDMTLYAKWTEIIAGTFKVTFMDGDKEIDSFINIVSGDTITLPPNPAKDGFTFVAWYTDDKLTTEFDVTMPITKDITLYAKWNEGEPVRFSVIVSGLEAAPSGKFWGASLMTGTARTTVKAASMAAKLEEGRYQFDLFPFEGTGIPNLGASFNTDGTYYVGLAITGMDQKVEPATTFILHKGGENPIEQTFNQTTPSYEYTKADFALAPLEEGQVPPKQFKLTVNNLGTPTNNTEGMWGASLMTKSSSGIVAVGVADGETFSFFAPNTTGVPDTTKPYTSNGEYFIGLSDVDLDDPTNSDNTTILYVNGVPAKISFNTDTPEHSYDKADFKPAIQQFKLTVNNLGTPNNDIWGAVLMSDVRLQMISAVGVFDSSDSFLFYAPVSSTDRTPNLEKPFTTKMSAGYFIGLSDVDIDNPTDPVNSVVLFEGGTMKKLVFDMAATPVHTVEKDDFESPTWFSLNITDLGEPSSGNSWVVSLVDGSSSIDSAAVAVGFIDIITKEISFWYPETKGNPDVAKPFNTVGNYYIRLTDKKPGYGGTVPDIVDRVLQDGGTPKAIAFNSANLSQTAAFADFAPVTP